MKGKKMYKLFVKKKPETGLGIFIMRSANFQELVLAAQRLVSEGLVKKAIIRDEDDSYLYEAYSS